MARLNLVPGQHRNLTICDPLLPHEDILLVELTEAALEEALAGTTSFKSQGGPADHLVFCTAQATFQCKHVSTTNMLLLCDITEEKNVKAKHFHDGHENQAVAASTGLLSQVQAGLQAADEVPVLVQAVANFSVETQKLDPPLQQLSSMLREHVYPQAEFSSEAGITWQRLQEEVLASSHEIVAGLQRLRAIAIKGISGDWRWHACDVSFFAEALNMLLLTCIQHGLSLVGFEPARLLSVLHQSQESFTTDLIVSEAAAVTHLLRTTCTSEGRHLPLIELGDGGVPCIRALPAGAVVAFDRAAVIRLIARKLLLQAPEQHWGAFLASWMDAVPAGRHWELPDEGSGDFSEAALRGIALVERRGPDKVVRRLDADDLPLDAAARFKALFKARAYWQLGDIEPYLIDVFDDGDTGKALLAKFSRVSQDKPGEEPLYSLR